MTHHIIRGILLMLAAVATFAVMDAAMKQLVQTYPPLQVSCLRGLASIPFFLLGVAGSRQWRSLIPVEWPGHLIRGALAILMLWTFIYAIAELSLGTAYGIVLCAPLLITALSAVVLREPVGAHRWFAIFFGLIGVFIILNPSGKGVMTLAGLAAFVSALCYAIAALTMRRLTRTESTLSIGLSFVVIIAVGTGILGYSEWIPLASRHWPWIVLLGFSGTVAQYLFIQAFRSAPVSVIAPFEYTALLWGIALDWVLWSTVPTTRMLCGGGIVIASGLYMIYREHRANRGMPKPIPNSAKW